MKLGMTYCAVLPSHGIRSKFISADGGRRIRQGGQADGAFCLPKGCKSERIKHFVVVVLYRNILLKFTSLLVQRDVDLI
jgi:hypothetical protein